MIRNSCSVFIDNKAINKNVISYIPWICPLLCLEEHSGKGVPLNSVFYTRLIAIRERKFPFLLTQCRFLSVLSSKKLAITAVFAEELILFLCFVFSFATVTMIPLRNDVIENKSYRPLKTTHPKTEMEAILGNFAKAIVIQNGQKQYTQHTNPVIMVQAILLRSLAFLIFDPNCPFCKGFAWWPILAIFKMLSFFEYYVFFGRVFCTQQL